MKISLIVFDLDGVLIDSKLVHWKSLNLALEEFGFKPISYEDHIGKYDGLSTRAKLDILGILDGADRLFDAKQKYTWEQFENLEEDQDLIRMFDSLLVSGYHLAVASNCIRETLELLLDKLGILDYIDLTVSNEDVSYGKPHPSMYWHCMSHFGTLPEETLIIEDSPVGLEAAEKSGAHVLRVKSRKDLSLNMVIDTVEGIEVKRVPVKEDINILIPMAGLGSRFADAGYTFPKPLIDVAGKTMIQRVVENIGINGNYIFVVRPEHAEKYNLHNFLQLVAPGCSVIEDHSTERGAACSCLEARNLIDKNKPLLIANSDQWIKWNPKDFLYRMNNPSIDGSILTFKDIHPKWSFCKIDQAGRILEVAEKNPISDNANVGIYYWKRGRDFFDFSMQMIDAEDKVKGEYYVAPVFNYAIREGLYIQNYRVEEMHGTGTPEDLTAFLKKEIL